MHVGRGLAKQVKMILGEMTLEVGYAEKGGIEII